MLTAHLSINSCRILTVVSESELHGKLTGARAFDFDTRGRFSLSWEFLRNGAISIFHVHVRC